MIKQAEKKINKNKNKKSFSTWTQKVEKTEFNKTVNKL